jgi:Cu/Ag efflux protein CusF
MYIKQYIIFYIKIIGAKMKKTLLIIIFISISLIQLNAQTKTEREPSFSGTSAQAAEWLEDHNMILRKIAGDAKKVIVYSGKTKASGSGVKMSFYDYRDLSKGQIGTVLEIADNTSGDILYIVWTDEEAGSKAVFYNDNDKTQLDVSNSVRFNKYGMGSDTKKYVRTIIKEMKSLFD